MSIHIPGRTTRHTQAIPFPLLLLLLHMLVLLLQEIAMEELPKNTSIIIISCTPVVAGATSAGPVAVFIAISVAAILVALPAVVAAASDSGVWMMIMMMTMMMMIRMRRIRMGMRSPG